MTIEESEVLHLFRNCNTRKSPGPDNIEGAVLKHCAEQLAPVFTDIFRSSLNLQKVPSIWKTSTIIPVPKIPRPSEPNDFRPIALTSLVMKCFERLVKRYLISQTQHLLDPMQFAYQASRGVEDAIATLLHLLHTHLEKPKAHAKILFADFSSAFNTIKPSILANILTEEFSLEPGLISWIVDFLSCRIQQVRIGMVLSDRITTWIGSPQGCVLSSLLFILYTNSCISTFPNGHFIKYADDTALVSLLYDEEEQHGPVLDFFINWCEKSNLLLNTSKTKEMEIDFRIAQSPNPTLLNGEPIQSVTEYKYLGVVLDHKLRWDVWSEKVNAKSQQRMFFLRKLLSFNVGNRMVKMFYHAFIESVLSFGIICWFGNATEAQKKSVRRAITLSSKLSGISFPSLESIYKDRVLKMALIIVSDVRHPLASSFELMPSGRRYRGPLMKKNRSRLSFVPQAIRSLNQ